MREGWKGMVEVCLVPSKLVKVVLVKPGSYEALGNQVHAGNL